MQRSGHPETIGTFGCCGDNAKIVSNIEEAKVVVKQIEAENIAIIAQTTFSMKGFDEIVEKIKEQLPKKTVFEVNKTICDATRIRQTETEQIAKEVDCMIIIGGKQSSNTKKLYEISKNNCEKVFFIQTVKELPIDEVKQNNKIGIMAGASTPAELIEEVKMALE